MEKSSVLIRLSHDLKSSLVSEAEHKGISLNELCCQKLRSPAPHEYIRSPEIAAAIEQAHAICKSSLLGVVLFGSWARGSPNDRSDIDLLFVLKPDYKITRSMYQLWQENQIGNCEPHFVCLPQASSHISGLWAEIAIDGVVLIDPAIMIQRYLMGIRRLIAEGKIRAKKIHGQNYWIHSEVA